MAFAFCCKVGDGGAPKTRRLLAGKQQMERKTEKKNNDGYNSISLRVLLWGASLKGAS